MNIWPVLLGMTGAVVGWRTAVSLASYGYRIPGDAPRGVRGGQPAVVLSMAVLWWALAARLLPTVGWPATAMWLLFCWIALVLIWIDVDVHRLPRGMVYPGYAALLVGMLLASVIAGWSPLASALGSSAATSAMLLVLSVFSAGGIGMGDVRLAALTGLALGWLGWSQAVLGVLVAFLLGGVSALALLVTRRAGAKTPIAFGPSLCCGALAIALWLPTGAAADTVLGGASAAASGVAATPSTLGAPNPLSHLTKRATSKSGRISNPAPPPEGNMSGS